MMEQIEYEQETALPSEEGQLRKERREFKQYLVDSGCVMHFIKYLLATRKHQLNDSEEPMPTLFPSPGPHPLLEVLKAEKADNERLQKEIIAIKALIENKKAVAAQKAEQKRLKEEQQAAKNTKKGGKK